MAASVFATSKDPCGEAIQPVYDTRTQVAANSGKQVEPMQQRVDDGSRMHTGARMHNHARRYCR